jgi:hypothetical protein
MQEYIFLLNTLADLVKIRENTNESSKKRNKFIESLQSDLKYSMAIVTETINIPFKEMIK